MSIPEIPSSEADSRRLAVLARILESFTATLDLEELLLRMVNTALEEFGADRAWLFYPGNLTADYGKVIYEATRPGWEGAYRRGEVLPLANSRELIREAMITGRPVISLPGDSGIDRELFERFHIRSRMMQVLKPGEDEPWVFGVHQCSHERRWTEAEADLFSDIGRYATIALSNAMLHRRAVAEAATVSAVIDQIPEAVAIYGPDGSLRRMNSVARSQLPFAFEGIEDPTSADPSGWERTLRDPRSGDDRTVLMKSAPVVDREGSTLGSVFIAADVSAERERTERDEARRNRAECLAYVGQDLFASPGGPVDLNQSAAMIATTLAVNVAFYLYLSSTDTLQLVGGQYSDEAGEEFLRYIERHPYRPGEGLPGTVFQIGHPLLFSDIRGEALAAFGRNEQETALKAKLLEQSLIACPMESYGERLGAMVISTSDPSVSFNVEDLAFAEAAAERVGSAVRIHRLTRIAQEGHRAAEDLARREVEARARLEAVLDSAPVAIAVVSSDELRFESANPPWLDYVARFGRVTADTRLIGLRAAEVMPGLEHFLLRAAESGQTEFAEAMEVRHNGEVWYVDQIIAPVRGRFSGITQSLTVLVQDVTEQVRAKREVEALAQIMEERSARLTSILGSMTDALLVYDAGGAVIDVNPSAVSMFGMASRSEAITRGSLLDLNLRYPDGRSVPRDDMPYQRALRGEVVPDYLAVARHLISGRDLDLSIAAAPIESATGIVGAVLVIRDITALQELDRKKDEFLSVASHELRTPLTTIRGYVQLLEQTIEELGPREQRTYLHAVLGEIERMMSLITELLDVSRIDTSRFQVEAQGIGWIEFVSRRIAAFNIQHPERRIDFRRPPGEITVKVDADRMRQVLDNLLSNALKYSPDGSAIEVIIEADENDVCTIVADRGIGIPEDEIPRLFDRFHRARNVSSRYYGGLGLGLYIAKAIVEAHGGAISVESAEGSGSKFRISLPRK